MFPIESIIIKAGWYRDITVREVPREPCCLPPCDTVNFSRRRHKSAHVRWTYTYVDPVGRKGLGHFLPGIFPLGLFT